MTRTSTVMGSPLYMSPEQMSSTRDVDGRTDIWALGVILFELLAGEPPFQADTLPQLCALVLNGTPRTVRSVAPHVPAGLEAVIQRCLQRDVALRYRDVAELASALASFAPQRARASVERISRVIQGRHSDRHVAGASVTAPALPTSPSWSETRGAGHNQKAPRTALWAGALLTAVGLAAALIWALRAGHAAPAAAQGAAAVSAAVTSTPLMPSSPAVIQEPTAVAAPVVSVTPVTAPSAALAAHPSAAVVARPTSPAKKGGSSAKVPVSTSPTLPTSPPADRPAPPTNLFDERK